MKGTLRGWLTNFTRKDLVFNQSTTEPAPPSRSESPSKRQRIERPVLAPTTAAPLPAPHVTAPVVNTNDLPHQLRGRIIYWMSLPRSTETKVKFRTTEGQIVVVQGKWPNADKDFEYAFECKKLVESSGYEVYHIQKWADVPMVPCPVRAIKFQLTVASYAYWLDPVQLTLKVAAPFLDPATAHLKPSLRLKNVEIPIDHITENFSGEEWYKELAQEWKPIRYKTLNTLLNFWSHRELHELHLDELEYIKTSLKSDPLPWFLHGYTELGLSAIPLVKSNLLRPHIDCALTADDIQIIAFYNSAYEFIERTKCRGLSNEDLHKLPFCPRPSKEDPGCATRVIQSITVTPKSTSWKRIELFMVIYEPPPIAGTRYYLTRDYRNFQTIQRYLTALLLRNPVIKEKTDRFATLRLHPEQAAAVDRIATKQNILIVTGDAGVGKTRVGQKIFGLFPSDIVLPLAMYGEVANKMRKVYGRGMTIDMCLERVRFGTALGVHLSKVIEVVIIDEIGVVTDDKIARLFVALPNLKKIIGLGDDKQLLPVGTGPVLKSMKRAWQGTNLFCELKENHRVDVNSELLLENFRSYTRGDIKAMQYTTDYGGDHPFHVIQRFPYPEECIFPEPGDLQNTFKRMRHMRDELAPIYNALIASGANMQKVWIFAQRGADVKLLNQAWFQLEHSDTNLAYKENVFYPGALVCFQKNLTTRKREWSKQTRCDPVSNNTTARIKEIYDVNPNRRMKFETAYNTRKQLKSTAEKKINEKWYRIIAFDDGSQINLHDYPLSLLEYGYAQTVASVIGAECETVIGWIQPRHVFVFRETLYTMMTRASKKVYLICDLAGDPTLQKSDIGVIYQKPAPELETSLVNYLPNPNHLIPVLPETIRSGPDFQFPTTHRRLDHPVPGFDLPAEEVPVFDQGEADGDDESSAMSHSQTNDNFEYISQANSRTDTCSSTPSPRAQSFIEDEEDDEDGFTVHNLDKDY
jgi:hypothetical protein